MENCSGWNMISIRNPGGGKSILFCKLFVPVWKPSVSVFMKGCDNSTVVTSTLIESTGKKKRSAERKQKQGHKKVQKNSVFSRFHSKVLPLALSRCLYRGDTNASEENGVVDLLSKGLLLCICVHPVFEIDLPLSSGVTLAICKLIPLDVLMRLIRASFLKRTSPAEMMRSVCFQTITDEPEKDCYTITHKHSQHQDVCQLYRL